MNYFLFPKSFYEDEDINFFSLVLKDCNNNRIFVEIKPLCDDDHDKHSSLSNNDLQTIHKELSKFIKSSDNNDQPNSLDHYLREQNKFLKQIQSTQQNSVRVEEKKLPSLEECLSCNEFIFKTYSDVLEIINDNDGEIFNEANELTQSSIVSEKRVFNDLYSVKEFVREFKRCRMELGVRQRDMGLLLTLYTKSCRSQTTVCRFESMCLSLANMIDLIPIFRQLLLKIYAKGRDSVLIDLKMYKGNVTELIDTDSKSFKEMQIFKNKVIDSDDQEDIVKVKKKRVRTQFTRAQIQRMEQLFQTVKFSSVTHKVYDKISEEIKVDKSRIKIWMSTRRRMQRLKMVKKK